MQDRTIRCSLLAKVSVFGNIARTTVFQMIDNLFKHANGNLNICPRLQLSTRYLSLVCVTGKIRYLDADQGVV